MLWKRVCICFVKEKENDKGKSHLTNHKGKFTCKNDAVDKTSIKDDAWYHPDVGDIMDH